MKHTTDHKEGNATVRIVYHNYRPMKDGSYQFYVCITKQRKRKYIATGLTLHPDYWDESRQRIRRSYPHEDRKKLEAALDKWEKLYSQAADELAEGDEVHQVADIAAKAIQGRKATRRVKLLAYIDELVASMTAQKQIGNSGIYRDLRNQLAAFLKDEREIEDIPFSDVTVKFCNDLEAYLRERDNVDTTLSNRFRTLRAVLNKAIAEGTAKNEHYPFARNVAEKHKFSIAKFDTSTTKRAINRNDIRKVETYEPTSERLQLAKDLFLFSFYVGGINFVDMATLRWENFTPEAEGHTRLTYVRQKTGGRFSLRLLKPALAILNTYQSFTQINNSSYVFPILNSEIHKDVTQIKNRCHKKLGQVNADLKMIAASVGINIPLTTYVARHSFASALKRSGVATNVISESMGHKTEAVTNTYLDSFGSEVVDSAFENLL